MSTCVTGWTSEYIHIGSAFSLCVCACVCFPATSIQQQGISVPDVCDLWSGRSCGGEASNVLNIISHRWSRVRTQQCSHTSGLRRPLSSLLKKLFLHMCASRPFLRLEIVPHPALTLLLLFSTESSSSDSETVWCHMALEPDPAGRVVDVGRPSMFHTRKALTSEGWWTEKDIMEGDNKKKEKMIFKATVDLPNPWGKSLSPNLVPHLL